MKGQHQGLLFSVCTGMELCYLYACVTFVTTAVFHQTFPFAEAVGSFLLAALLTLFSEGRGWRVIYVLGIQSLGFVPALVRMVGVFNSWSDSFQSQTWFTQSLASPADSVGYFIIFLVTAWALVFWAGGVGLARRPRDYYTVCSRFDRGLIAFFLLFLTEFYLQAVQGIHLDEPISGFMLFPFLIFSLLAIGLARNQGAAQRDFLPGYQTIGVMLGFIIVILLAGTGLVLFSLPLLTQAAQQGNNLLYIISTPFISVLFSILAWLFGTDFNVPEALPEKKQALADSSVQWSFPWWVELLGRILAWGIGILLVLVLLAIVGGLLYSMLLWLFSKTSTEQEKTSPREVFSSFIAQLRSLVAFIWRSVIRNLRGYAGAIQLYTALRTWGRVSGLPCLLHETPTEYGLRLEHRFPALAAEIELIVQAFNRQVYGEIALDQQQLGAARSAWGRLTSPSHWPMRIRGWFTLPSQPSDNAPHTISYQKS